MDLGNAAVAADRARSDSATTMRLSMASLGDADAPGVDWLTARQRGLIQTLTLPETTSAWFAIRQEKLSPCRSGLQQGSGCQRSRPPGCYRLSYHPSPELDFGQFRRRMRERFAFEARYGAEFLYYLGVAGT